MILLILFQTFPTKEIIDYIKTRFGPGTLPGHVRPTVNLDH